MAAIEADLTQAGCVRFCVAVSTTGNWHRLWRANGSAAPCQQGQPRRSKLDACEAHILAMVEEDKDKDKDITLYVIAERLAQECGVGAAPSMVWNFLDKRDITFKK